MQKLITELSTKNFDSIRNDLYTEDEIYESLSEVIIDGYSILMFLGVGFNRAAFLISAPNGQRLVAKIPIRSYGFSDNRTEVYLSRESRKNVDINVLARTEPTARSMYVLQEACKPVPWDQINVMRQRLIENAARRMKFDDIQAGISLEDGEVRVYDFALLRD